MSDGWLANARPSCVWEKVNAQLGPWVTPGQYVRELREAGLSWRQVGNVLHEDTGVRVGDPGGTCAYWANVDWTHA